MICLVRIGLVATVWTHLVGLDARRDAVELAVRVPAGVLHVRWSPADVTREELDGGRIRHLRLVLRNYHLIGTRITSRQERASFSSSVVCSVHATNRDLFVRRENVPRWGVPQ